VKIAYHVAGDGPGLLLTHGFGSSSHMWESNVEALSAHHTVVTWDLRGHGESDYPENQDLYRPELVVEDMRSIMRECGFNWFTPVGMSVGGYLSLLYAVSHPDTLESLILVDAGPGFRDDDARAKWNDFAENDRARRFEELGVAALEEGRSEFRRDVHKGAAGLARAARGFLTQYDSSVIEGLATIVVPTLVVAGVNDHAFLRSCHYIAKKIPGAQLVEIPNAGHASNIDNAPFFNDAVSRFLDGTSSHTREGHIHRSVN
jgi:Predicted hydrolases or acyltransferases (alpha/beta hydrolase superfamily)